VYKIPAIKRWSCSKRRNYSWQ